MSQASIDNLEAWRHNLGPPFSASTASCDVAPCILNIERCTKEKIGGCLESAHLRYKPNLVIEVPSYRIADDRMPHRRHVKPKLVTPAGVRRELDSSCIDRGHRLVRRRWQDSIGRHGPSEGTVHERQWGGVSRSNERGGSTVVGNVARPFVVIVDSHLAYRAIDHAREGQCIVVEFPLDQ